MLNSLGISRSVDEIREALAKTEQDFADLNYRSLFGKISCEEYWKKWDSLVLKHLDVAENEELAGDIQARWFDYVDIFLSHFVKSCWINGCHQGLRELNDLKTTGIVKAIGLSTYSVAVVREASRFKELDAIMTTCSKADQAKISKFQKHIPLEDGSIQEMFDAIELPHDSGKGIIAMKVLGTGAPPMVRNYQSSIKAIAQLDFVDAMVIGLRSLDEVKKM